MIYSDYFDRRKNTFEKSYELIMKNIKENICYNIIELGSSRSFVTDGLEGSMSTNIKYWNPNEPKLWDWGAGIFTKVFLENLKEVNHKLYTIDPDSDAIAIVKVICNDYENVSIIQDYSTNFINNFNDKIDFLYMDHMETSEEAAKQHLEDAKIIIEKDLMNKNGIILIDDIGYNIIDGKGKYSIPFLLENGYEIVIHEYQVLMKKK
jgi:hypothetical protein